MSLETLKQTQLGREEIKRIAEAGKSGAVIDKEALSQSVAIDQAYDADNRDGMGNLSVGDAMNALRIGEMHDLLSPTEQAGIETGTVQVLVDFGGNVTSRQVNAE